jgi:hypothetical protein
MPLIKARTNRIKSLRHISRLLEPNRETLLLYAKFIGDTPDHVLNQVIELVLSKDRDFVGWRAEHVPGSVNDRDATPVTTTR